MQVYVLVSNCFHEGTTLHGVYGTLQLARDAKAELIRKHRAKDDIIPDFRIREFPLVDGSGDGDGHFDQARFFDGLAHGDRVMVRVKPHGGLVPALFMAPAKGHHGDGDSAMVILDGEEAPYRRVVFVSPGQCYPQDGHGDGDGSKPTP